MPIDNNSGSETKNTETLDRLVFDKFLMEFSPLFEFQKCKMVRWPLVNLFFNRSSGLAKSDAHTFVKIWAERGWISYCGHLGIKITDDMGVRK